MEVRRGCGGNSVSARSNETHLGRFGTDRGSAAGVKWIEIGGLILLKFDQDFVVGAPIHVRHE